MFPDIKNYHDLVKKLEYDLERFNKEDHTYSFMDCLMTLNSLPEWIVGSTDASERLIGIAKAKLAIMKFLPLVESELNNNIDQQLRFVRFTCNNSKHPVKKIGPIIFHHNGCTLPIILNAYLGTYIAIGGHFVSAKTVVNSVANFWIGEINAD